MNAYIYQAEIYCEDCGEAICKQLFDEGNCPSLVELEQELYDSDDFPKGPYPDGGGEADFPQYCAECHEPLGNHAINHHPGSEYFRKTWQRMLNESPGETFEAYFGTGE